MAYQNSIEKFGNNNFLPEGWFWLLKSKDLKPEKALPAKLLDRDFVIYRGEDGVVRAMDAYCPHMGAHLCDGMVENNSIRCPFHYWKYNTEGICEEIPAQADTRVVPHLTTYPVQEAYGLIWLWTGGVTPDVGVPVVPELEGFALDYSFGNEFIKDCHPNVVMINAIDAHHFRSVHNLIVDLNLVPKVLNEKCVQFSNATPLPKSNFLLRWISRFYEKSLTYEMTYWWGNVGTVMVGPDFLHFYIMFALRPTSDGKTEGQTVLITKKRPLSWLVNPVILFLTRLVGNYFAKGDTLIFSRIKFNFRTPIRADKAIIDFVAHYEQQKSASFGALAISKKTLQPLEG